MQQRLLHRCNTMIKQEKKSSQSTLSISHGNQTPKRKIHEDDDGILALGCDVGITDTSKESTELFLIEDNNCSIKSQRVTASQKTDSNS